MSFLELNHLKKVFGDTPAVRDFGLSAERGEFISLLGPSGCGKTTLLRMIAGFEFPTEGEIYIDNQPVTGVPANKRPTNMVFQSYAIFPHLDVYDNVAYGLRKLRLPKAELDRRVKEALGMIRMDGFERRRADQMSGGQRQRVALARSLAKLPKLLLLDEPLGALDKKLREHTQFEIANIQYKLGITFVVVTHDQEEAMTLASRIAVMDKGLIRQIGSPSDIYEHPNSRFVADFIGSANMVEAEVTKADGAGTEVLSPSLGHPILVASNGYRKGDKVTLAFRPEKVTISRKKPAAAKNVLKGTVQDFGYFGKDSLYRIKLPTGHVLSVNAVNAERTAAEQAVATWEDEVYLTIAPAAAMLFGAET